MIEFTEYPNLASERLGGAVLAANDEFFAPKEGLLKTALAEWRETAYTERGKWMDGWETRRRRDDGYDWAVIRLGSLGVVHGVVVDTAWFRGNYPDACSIDACRLPGVPSLDEVLGAEWVEILPRVELQGNTGNLFPIRDERPWTHVRLNIYPDGGVARLRVHGEVQPAWSSFVQRGGEADLAALENGGWAMACSDKFYGHPQNLILPGRSTHMGDGWETRRRRGPGNDWIVVRLAATGALHRLEIDTDHFKGNAPDHVSVDALYAPGASEADLAAAEWRTLLPETHVEPHTRHRWEDGQLGDVGPVTHVRLNVFPDGGVARMRVFGTLTEPGS